MAGAMSESTEIILKVLAIIIICILGVQIVTSICRCSGLKSIPHIEIIPTPWFRRQLGTPNVTMWGTARLDAGAGGRLSDKQFLLNTQGATAPQGDRLPDNQILIDSKYYPGTIDATPSTSTKGAVYPGMRPCHPLHPDCGNIDLNFQSYSFGNTDDSGGAVASSSSAPAASAPAASATGSILGPRPCPIGDMTCGNSDITMSSTTAQGTSFRGVQQCPINNLSCGNVGKRLDTYTFGPTDATTVNAGNADASTALSSITVPQGCAACMGRMGAQGCGACMGKMGMQGCGKNYPYPSMGAPYYAAPPRSCAANDPKCNNSKALGDPFVKRGKGNKQVIGVKSIGVKSKKGKVQFLGVALSPSARKSAQGATAHSPVGAAAPVSARPMPEMSGNTHIFLSGLPGRDKIVYEQQDSLDHFTPDGTVTPWLVRQQQQQAK